MPNYTLSVVIRKAIIYLVIIGFLMIIPWSCPSYITGLVTVALISAICAMSYDLLMGYTGLVSFGHTFGWGIGAYTVGILVGKGITTDFWVVAGVAILAAAAVGAIFALVAFRTHGIYFSLITLALAQLLHALTLKWSTVTGGENGLTGISRPWSLEDLSFYYFTAACFLILFALMRQLVNSWFGRILVGIRENESRMITLGYNTWVFKYAIFVISGILASFAGLLSGYYRGIASPEDFYFMSTGHFLLMVLIGGRGTLIGPILGSFFVVFASNYLSAYTDEWMMILGIMFVLVVMFARKGIGGYLQEWKGWIAFQFSRRLSSRA